MTDSEDREQQAGISRHLLYYLNAPIAEGCRLRGVLPASGAVRIAIRAGEGEGSDTFLYEIPHDSVAPARIPGVLRAILSEPQFYGSGDVSDVLGMTLFRLRPEEITPAPEPEEGKALRALLGLGLGGGPDDENPFVIGFLMKDDGLMRVYVERPGHSSLIGVDIRLTDQTTALTASIPSLIEEEERYRPSLDDPHCDLVVDLTDW
ncbi:hypothetical protein ACFRMN_00850 [Streptomyces sp. NPDC056835]|uniref:hypothetical protein n=1 Tax=Streptomyces sp. NPDC056835 TaxID=3345956 RepID=UPI0036CE2FE3